MSLSDRYQEAERLMAEGKIESALLTTLVCVAAASRIVAGNPKDPKDGELFRSYIYHRITGDLLQVGNNRVDFEAVLYRNVRNDLIHQAKIDGMVFDPRGDYSLRYENGKISFGRQLVWSLLDTMRRDYELRDEFRSILLPTENIVELRDHNSLESLWDELCRACGNGFVMFPRIWEMFVRAYTPERLSRFTNEQAREFYKKYVVDAGDVTGLHAEMLNPKWSAIVLTNNVPSDLALDFSRKISPLFVTHDCIEE